MENENIPTMEGLLESFGLSKAAATENPAPPTEQPAPTEEAAEPAKPAETSETAQEPSEPVTEEAGGNVAQQSQAPATSDNSKGAEELPLESLNKQAHTFAEMRKTISEQNKVLGDIGKALGLSGDPKEILEGIQKITNAQKAKEAGVPPEIMERIQALEKEKAQRDEEDKKLRAYASINQFQRNMGLDKTQLNSFLIQLAKAGKNPFETSIDLKAEYLVMNFDRLQKEAVQKALEKQAALDSKANLQGTNPGTKVGGGENKTTEIKTMDGLEAFLKANIK